MPVNSDGMVRISFDDGCLVPYTYEQLIMEVLEHKSMVELPLQAGHLFPESVEDGAPSAPPPVTPSGLIVQHSPGKQVLAL